MERHYDVGFSAGNLAFTAELAGFRGFADCRNRSRINLLESNQRQVSLHPSFLTFLVGIATGCLYALCGGEARRRDDCGIQISVIRRFLLRRRHPREAFGVEALV